jgi:CRISPR-associated protein Cmr6
VGGVAMNTHLSLTKRVDQVLFPSDSFNSNKTDQSEAKKSEFYHKVINQFNSKWNSEVENKWYKHRFDFFEQNLRTSLASRGRIVSTVLESISPMIIGSGGTSVLETSLVLHRIYGVPYIPGTAIKGLTSHYCHLVLGKKDEMYQRGGKYHTAIFGSQTQAGVVEFHDAWITPDSLANSLMLDVMTPHHQEYNSIQVGDNSEKNSGLPAPRDDDDPVPIPFISVQGNFRFIVTCSHPGVEDQYAKQWLMITREILIEALKHEGVGGKTNAGYGRMKGLDNFDI